MKIESPAFANNQTIPLIYAVDGQNINPPLIFSEIPENSQSLVLIMDDPDAPIGIWTHWVLWNISPTTKEIKENSVPAGSVQGKTNRANCYSGPKPPSGTHRYFFKLYAIDTVLDLEPTASVEQLTKTIKNHTVDYAELIGIYHAKN
jgi:Raf kinase inhibitor-like YbhB/YbcL family protein